MSGSGVPDGDMPSFPWPMHQDESDVTDVGLAALLAGKADAVAGLQPVADVLAALTADATSEELANEASALAEFRRAVGVSAHQLRPHRRRPTVLKSMLSAKAAAAVGTIAVLLGGAATAAFANELPAPLQHAAHEAIGAPDAKTHSGAHQSKTPARVGPDATSHPAYGLCTAFSDAKADGDAAQKAVAYRNLTAAAGGAGKIAAYCAAVPHPGASHSQQGDHGKPAAHPSAHGKPTALPTPHGKPTALPTPHA